MATAFSRIRDVHIQPTRLGEARPATALIEGNLDFTGDRGRMTADSLTSLGGDRWPSDGPYEGVPTGTGA